VRRSEPRQSWDQEDDDRVRVLLECAPDDSPSIIATTIEREGYAVRTCNGPGDVVCDLDRHGACDLVEGADVVVNLLPGAEGRQLADRIASARRPPAVVAQVLAGAEGSPAPDAAGAPRGTVVRVRTPPTRRSLLDAIRTALAGTRD
jgi:hypothetical protein